MMNFPSPKSPTLQVTILVTVSAFVAFLMLAIFMKVEVVAQGTGKFLPKARTQIVQSEFGGRIERISVSNGQNVKQGDILIVLDGTVSQTELDTVRLEIQNLQLVRDRIDLALELFFVKQLNENLASDAIRRYELGHFDQRGAPIFLSQRGLLEAEFNFIASNVARMDAELAAFDQASDLTQISLDQTRESWEIYQVRFESVRQLRENGTATQLQYDEALDQVQRSSSEIKLREKELEQNGSRRIALEQGKDSFIKEQINALSRQQSEVLLELAKLQQRLISNERELSASLVTAPIDGIVDQLSVHTIGGVVDVGEELLRLVPIGSDLIFEAVLSNQNIAFLETGLPVKLGVDAYPSERFGFLDGYISNISADAIEVDENTLGYLVQITPSSSGLDFKGGNLELRPGMTATADVITDERRLISYFIAPIIDTIQNSLSER